MGSVGVSGCLSKTGPLAACGYCRVDLKAFLYRMEKCSREVEDKEDTNHGELTVKNARQNGKKPIEPAITRKQLI